MRTIKDMHPELHLLGRTLTKYTQVAKQPTDFGVGTPLYPAEIHCLSDICAHQPLSLGELAGYLGVTRGAASQLVSRLVDKGLATKEPDPDNGSRILLHPTPLGERAQQEHLRFHARHDKEFLHRLGTLSDDEYRTFSRICSWLDQWMDSYLD